MKTIALLTIILTAFPSLAFGQSPQTATYVNMKEQGSAPANPAASFWRLYVDNTGALKLLSSAGATTTFGTGSGSVTSVALSAPAIFSVSGSPVTTTGTLAFSLASQTQNQVWAAPDGSDGNPLFRALVAADIPSLNASKITAGTIDTARLGSGTANSTTYLRGDQTWQTISSSGVTLQGSSPGTPDTGNLNVSGTGLSAKYAVGISSPTFTTSNKFMVAATPTTADGTAEAIFGSSNTTNTPILIQPPASFTGNYFSVQRSDGNKTFTVNPYGSAAELRIYNANVQVASLYANTTETFFSSVGAYPTRIGANNAYQWEVTSAGHWVPYTSASRDIGTSSVRVRSGYFNNDIWGARIALNNTSPSFGTYNTFILGTNMGIADNNGLMVGTIADGRKGIVLQEAANPNTTPLIEGQRLTGGRLFSFGNNASVGDIQIAYNGTTYGRFYWNTNTSLQAGSGQVLALGSNATDHITLNTSGVLTTKATAASASVLGTSGAVTLDCNLSNFFTITPAGDTTINLSNVTAGQDIGIRVLTSGTTSYTITLGTSFKSTGTFATGTTTAKKAVLKFLCDGTDCVEYARSGLL